MGKKGAGRRRRPGNKSGRSPGSQRGQFKPGRNTNPLSAQADATHRRGPDHLPRGTVTMLLQSVFDDDGSMLREAKLGTHFRDKVVVSLYQAVSKPGSVIKALEAIADRLEGKPVQKVETEQKQRITVFREATPQPEAKPHCDTHAQHDPACLPCGLVATSPPPMAGGGPMGLVPLGG